MILAVNIGNTNIRAVVGKKETITLEAIKPAEELNANNDFISFIEESFGADIWGRVKGSIISTVVPRKTSFVAESIELKTGKTPQRVDIKKCRLLNTSQYSGLLGEDRVVCCAGALTKYKTPFILIDFGTAATVNVVNGDGDFIGGAILAGVGTQLLALSDNTAQLPKIEIGTNIPVIGKNTSENLLSGAVIGLSCAIEGYIRLIELELNCTMNVIITGGHAKVVLPYCNFKNNYEPSMLITGLLALYNE